MSITEEKCPNCTAPLRYDPASGKKVCDFCGTVLEIPQNPEAPKKIEKPKRARKPVEPETQAAEIEGFDFGSLDEQATALDAARLPVYNCISCGAEVLSAAEQFSLRCPYCGNNIILTDKISGTLRPNGLIPFRITPEQLPAAMTGFYKNRILLPRDFFSESRMGKVTGVYVPFWVFEGELSGRKQFYATKKARSYWMGQYEVTEYHNYELLRDVAIGFRGLPVDASSRLDDAMMDSLEPFDLSVQTEFRTDYLQGFTADRFDVAKGDISERALRRMQSSMKESVDQQAGAGYLRTVETGGRLQAHINARYLLFPVYTFQIHFKGKPYDFVVNGQTGKVVGRLPMDTGIQLRYFCTRALAIGAISMLWKIVQYFLGR